jgi:hypothetical protein
MDYADCTAYRSYYTFTKILFAPVYILQANKNLATVVTLTFLPSSLNLYSISFLIPLDESNSSDGGGRSKASDENPPPS